MTKIECVNKGFKSCGKLSDGTELYKKDGKVNNCSYYEYFIIKDGFTTSPTSYIISKEILEQLLK